MLGHYYNPLLERPDTERALLASPVAQQARRLENPLAEKVETELGWKPLTSWEEGLQKTIRWYKENQDWVNRIRNGAYREYYKEMYGGLV